VHGPPFTQNCWNNIFPWRRYMFSVTLTFEKWPRLTFFWNQLACYWFTCYMINTYSKTVEKTKLCLIIGAYFKRPWPFENDFERPLSERHLRDTKKNHDNMWSNIYMHFMILTSQKWRWVIFDPRICIVQLSSISNEMRTSYKVDSFTCSVTLNFLKMTLKMTLRDLGSQALVS
jgi:hypothetical protein